MPDSARPLLFVTGNPGKLAEAKRLAGEGLQSVALDLPEIQSLDLEEVLLEKARSAFQQIGRPLVVEEAGLTLSAMHGFPGPLVRWMLDAMGAEGVARSALALGDPGAAAVAILAWTDGERVVLGRGEVRGQMVLPPRGDHGFGFDPVFLPAGSERTFGELTGTEKDRTSHRGIAWRELLRALARGSVGLS